MPARQTRKVFCECVPAIMKAGFFMRIKSLMTDDVAICRAVMRISHDILERSKGTQGIEAALSTCGTPEIRSCREDLTFKQETPCVRLAAHPSISQNKTDIFVEYVVNTSRTIWATVDAAFLAGLPAIHHAPKSVGAPGMSKRADYMEITSRQRRWGWFPSVCRCATTG